LCKFVWTWNCGIEKLSFNLIRSQTEVLFPLKLSRSAMNFRARLSLFALESRDNPSGPQPVDPVGTAPPPPDPIPPTTPVTTAPPPATTTTPGS
jgi:hypothetical protein